MNQLQLTAVERAFARGRSGDYPSNITYITVENFPMLGLLTSLRFLEWVYDNPEGVISLPTGKTPEHFINWTAWMLDNWHSPRCIKIREDYGLQLPGPPDMSRLRFVQIDEFYPVNPRQHNSFCNYVKRFYINKFSLDERAALLINCDEIALAGGKHHSEVFPGGVVDLGLRYREPANRQEVLQQESLFLIDNWCSVYEERIREMGGIGFFLGGIGPDGHVAFNTRGSDHHSTTRLTATNFETQAVAAGDLGGMEVSRNKLVITIGLETIVRKSDATAIIFAAGEAKAAVVRDALEREPSNIYPATVLAKLPNARFYLTTGAASQLKEYRDRYFIEGEWSDEKRDRAIIDLCNRIGRFGDKLTEDDLKGDQYCKLIPGVSLHSVEEAIESFSDRIGRGTEGLSHKVFLHTGPHHDDIMLGLLPHIHRLSRNETNSSHFSILTSGFTAVTNKFMAGLLEDTIAFLDNNQIGMTRYPDFFERGYRIKRDKDVYHYLIKVASGQPGERRRGFAHRLIRDVVEIWAIKSIGELREKLVETLETLRGCYDGEKVPAEIQLLKGMIREYEEELVWACFGITANEVHHLRLGFYTGDIFTPRPNRTRDVEPVLQQLRKINPDIISLAFDPEGSGPDTHYKVLQTIAGALREWQKERELPNLKIWGYRNVWYQFHPAEATHIVPVSLSAMGIMDNTFTNCYLSQVDASFPSYQYDGKFSDLAQKIWVEQLRRVQLLLGKPFFYQNESPRLRTTHGLLFFKEMSLEEFLTHARELEHAMEAPAPHI